MQPDQAGFGTRTYLGVSERKLSIAWPGKGSAPVPLELTLPKARGNQVVWVGIRADKLGNVKRYQTKIQRPRRRRATLLRRGSLARAGALPPVNDDCANALPLSDGAVAFSTLEATTDGPSHAVSSCLFDPQTYEDVWYVYSATCTGFLTASTCNVADFDTKLLAYDGSDCSNLVLLGCNDDAPGCGTTSELTVAVIEGNEYLIRIGAFNQGEQGAGTLTLRCTPGPPVPTNDDCSMALSVDCNTQTTVNNLFATTDPTDPAICIIGGSPGLGTIWFSYTAIRSGALFETTNSAVQDTILVLFDGSDCDDLNIIDCSDDIDALAGNMRSKISISNLVVGRTYLLMVSSFDSFSVGDITLDVACPAPKGACCLPDGTCDDEIEVECLAQGGVWDPTTNCAANPCPQPPANDRCTSAEFITSLPASLTFNNEAADSDVLPGASCDLASGPFRNAWYELIGTGNTISVSTCNSGTDVSDTKIAVYCVDCGDQVCVGGNDDDCPMGPGLLSTFSFASQAGARYMLTVGSFATFTMPGNIQVDVSDDGVPATGAIECQPRGACCLDAGLCTSATEADCDAMAGDFLGAGSRCGDERVADGGLELGAFGGAWSETSTTFGTPICDLSCGSGNSSDPTFEGSFWAWFGGVQGALENASLEQSVFIPSALGATLEFYLEIPVASGNGLDVLELTLDGNLLFTAFESDQPSFGTYTRVTLDVSAFADGALHTLRFFGQTTGFGPQGQAATTNFFVDGVSLIANESGCR